MPDVKELSTKSRMTTLEREKSIFVWLKDEHGHEIEILIPIEHKEILIDLIRGTEKNA